MDAAILYGLLAMLGFGLSNALSQEPARKLGVTRSIFYRNLVTSSLLLIILVVTWSSQRPSWTGVALALALAAVGYIPLWAFTRAVQLGKLGVISPVANASLVISVLVSLLLFHEALGAARLAIIAAIFLGLLLISIHIQDWRRSSVFDATSGVPHALLACVGWGILFALWKYPVALIGPILTAFLVEFGILVISGAQLARTRSFGKIDAQTARIVLALGICGTAGVLFYDLGINVAAVGLVTAITQASPWISVIYGHLAHHERLKPQQYAGIALIVLGLAGLALL